MIEIEKLRLGRKVSINEYNQAKLDFDELYANASDDDKARIDGLMQSSQNYSSANPMNNRSTREYQTQLYKNASAILKGEMTPSMAPTKSTPNIFNGYSSLENQNNANYVTQRYLSHAGKPKTGVASGPAPATGLYHRYNWANGLSSGWTLDSDTLEDRMRSFAETLTNNLNTALGAKAAGKKLVGIDENNVELAFNALQGKTWTKDNFKDLMRAAQLAGVDPASFRDYFGDLFPGMSATDKAKKALTDNGYELVDNFNFGDYANDFANYKVAKKGDRYYLINSDYSGPATNAAKVFMNTDWRDPNKEGHGYIVSDDGSFIIGDLNPYYNNSQSQYYNQLQQYVKDQGNDTRATWKDYDRLTDLSNYDIIEDNSAALHGHSVADMSRYFDTEAPIVATIEGDDWNTARSRYGHTKLDDKRIKYYWKNGNENKSGTYQDLLADLQINPNLSKSDVGRGYTNWSSAGVSLAGLSPENDDFWTKDINRYNQFLNFFSNNWYNQVNKNLWSNDKIDADQDIQKNPDGTARLLVQLLATDDNQLTDEQRRIKNRWWTEHSMEAIYLISEQLRKNPELFRGDHEKDYRRAWHAILKAYRNKLPSASSALTDVAVEKEGGILKAAEGAYVDLQGNQYAGPEKIGGYAASVREKANKIASETNKNSERALENGRTKLLQKEIDRNAWTSSDTLRATALATDVAGLIAAIAGPATSGVGSAIAIGSGFASMAQDAIADFTDEKVSTGQALKNVGINSGLAIGAMFGAKAPKMVKSAMKIVPKAMMALGAAGVVMDPEIQKTVDKVASGKGLNVNDWKNISVILRTATGIATVGTMSYKGKKGAEYGKKVENQKLQEITSELDPNIKYIGTENGKKAIPINKDLHAEITKKLSSGEEKDINDALATLMKSKEQGGAGLSEADAKSVLLESAKKKKGLVEKLKFWKEPETETTLREATTEQIENLTGRDLRAEAKLAAIKELRAKAQSHNSALLNKLEGTKVVESLNPALNQALSGTGYKNIRELVAEENKLVKPHRAFDLKDGIALNESEVAAVNKDVHAAMKPKGVNIVASEGQATASAEVRTKKGELKALEKLEKQLNKQLADAEAKLKVAEEELVKANEEFELANKQLTSGESRKKILRNLKRAEDRLKKAQDEAKTALSQFDEIEAVYNSPEFKSLYGKNASSAISKNSALSQQLAQLEKAKNDLSAQKEAMRGLLLFKGKYDANGNPIGKKGAHVDLEKQLIAATDAYNKASKNPRFIGGKTLWKDYETRKQKTDDTSRLVADLNNRINLLKSQLASSGSNIRSAKQVRTDAQAKRLQAINVAKGIKDQLAVLGENKNNKLKELDASRKNLAKVNEKIRARVSAERMKELRTRGKVLARPKSSATIVVDGVNTTISTGTKTTSFAHIQNEERAKRIAMLSPTAKELSRSEIEKLYPSNVLGLIRGAAYDTATKEITIWEQGGLINSKYSHLRK